MAGINFDGTYQQQGLSLQFLSSHYNPVPNSEVGTIRKGYFQSSLQGRTSF